VVLRLPRRRHPGSGMGVRRLRGRRKVACPARLVLWGGHSHTAAPTTGRLRWSVPRYCSNIVRMQELPCGHYPSDKTPERDLPRAASAFSAPSPGLTIFAPEREITSLPLPSLAPHGSRNALRPGAVGLVSEAAVSALPPPALPKGFSLSSSTAYEKCPFGMGGGGGGAPVPITPPGVLS